MDAMTSFQPNDMNMHSTALAKPSMHEAYHAQMKWPALNLSRIVTDPKRNVESQFQITYSRASRPYQNGLGVGVAVRCRLSVARGIRAQVDEARTCASRYRRFTY